MNEILCYILSIMSIIGGFFTANKSQEKRFVGFTLWTIVNVGWIFYSIHTHIYGQLIMWVAYLITSIYGMWNNRIINEKN